MIRDFGQLFLLTKIKKILREKNRNYEIHTFAFKIENYSFEQRTTSSTFSQGKNSTIIARTTRRSGFRSFSTDYREIQHSSLRFQNYSWRPRESIFGKLRAGYVRNRSPLRIREGVKKGRGEKSEKKERKTKSRAADCSCYGRRERINNHPCVCTCARAVEWNLRWRRGRN